MIGVLPIDGHPWGASRKPTLRVRRCPAHPGSHQTRFGCHGHHLLALMLVVLVGCRAYDYDLGANQDVVSFAGGSRSGGDSSSGGETSQSGSSGSAGVDTPDPTELIGWASITECGPRGTTGGEGGPVVRPTTPEELDAATRADGPSIIEISGRMELGDLVPILSGDKTLLGRDDAEFLGAVRVRDARNVVLKNIRFNGGGVPSSMDALEIDNSSCVWIHHCEFVDGGDDNLDIVRGSDLITVSWSKFSFQAKTDSHRLASVCGNSNDDWPGRINITFHHNWWGEGLLSHMPSVRHGMVHVFNSYFDAAGNDFCIGAHHMSKLLVQNNVFESVNDPIVFQLDDGTAEVVESGNDFSQATGEHVSRGTSFEPPYPFTLEDTATAKTRVLAESGRL